MTARGNERKRIYFSKTDIVNAVPVFFGIDNKEFLNDRKECRNISIYIMKKYTGMTNGQIGQIFNGLTFFNQFPRLLAEGIENYPHERFIMNKKLTAIIEREGDGYVALCPELDVASQGDTVDEARRNLQEALELLYETASPEEIEARLHEEVYVTHVEVAVG